MTADHSFALFIEDQKGPMLRQYCDDLEEAKRLAQELADREGFPIIVFSFDKAQQVAKFKPRAQN